MVNTIWFWLDSTGFRNSFFVHSENVWPSRENKQCHIKSFPVTRQSGIAHLVMGRYWPMISVPTILYVYKNILRIFLDAVLWIPLFCTSVSPYSIRIFSDSFLWIPLFCTSVRILYVFFLMFSLNPPILYIYKNMQRIFIQMFIMIPLTRQSFCTSIRIYVYICWRVLVHL